MTVTNYGELENVALANKTGVDIYDATITNDKITITGKKIGTGSFDVTADNANTLKITVTVKNQTIDIDKTDFTLSNTTPVKRKINNYDALKNVTVSSADATIATATLDGNNKGIQVTGVKTGNTTCTIKADNADDVNININVTIGAFRTSEKTK